ncbi:MAG: FkbM family methyltransferase [Bdellovibrionales bacterium]
MNIFKTFSKAILLIPLLVIHFFGKMYSTLLQLIKPNLGFYWCDTIAAENKNLIQEVIHKSTTQGEAKLKIYTPNWICRYRVTSFSTKEPETLEWIDQYGGNGPLFDIGANVGLYSMYFAATKKQKVYAFEPSFFNLALLAKNIYVNNLQDRIHVVANPLSETNQFSKFSLSTTEEGGALSTFGVDFGYDGKALQKSLEYKTLGFSLDYLISQKIVPELPAMIKVDVDGIEHLILAGAVETLKSPICRTVLIEVNQSFQEQATKISELLKSCGFSPELNNLPSQIGTGEFSEVSNQIWVKR